MLLFNQRLFCENNVLFRSTGYSNNIQLFPINTKFHSSLWIRFLIYNLYLHLKQLAPYSDDTSRKDNPFSITNSQHEIYVHLQQVISLDISRRYVTICTSYSQGLRLIHVS